MNMDTAPKNGKRILLHYKITYNTGDKWEECRWISDQANTGSKPHWEPWGGAINSSTTHHITEAEAIEWRELP